MAQWLICYLWVSKAFDYTNQDTIQKAVKKLLAVRLWADEQWKLKQSVQDIEWSILVISNFTLRWTLKKWTSIDFANAQSFDLAQNVYDSFIQELQAQYDVIKIYTGSFGAMMEVESVNDGPVNIVIDL